MAKLDFFCRHVPTVYSIYPLWFSLSWSFAEVFLFCIFCCGCMGILISCLTNGELSHHLMFTSSAVGENIWCVLKNAEVCVPWHVIEHLLSYLNYDIYFQRFFSPWLIKGVHSASPLRNLFHPSCMTSFKNINYFWRNEVIFVICALIDCNIFQSSILTCMQTWLICFTTEHLILAKCFTEEANSGSIMICKSQVTEKANSSDTLRPLNKVQTLCPELRL